MSGNIRLFKTWITTCALVFAAALSIIYAQDQSLADIKYREDYDRIQSIIKIGDLVKRAEKMMALYAERRDMDVKLRDYADNVFARDLETLTKQGNFIAVKGISERILKTRPNFGAVYMFYGIALKRDNKIDEALTAFARGSALPNGFSTRSKQQLDMAYRAKHGTLVGEDKFIKDSVKGIK